MTGEPPALVSVPTHFYKVILADGRNSAKGSGGGRQVSIGAFVMPNWSRDLTRVSLHIGQRRGLCDAEWV